MTNQLTGKQRAFIDAYLGKANFNATRPFQPRGYKGSRNTLSAVGSENLSKSYIKEYIEKRINSLEKDLPSAVIKSLGKRNKVKQSSIGYFYLISAPNGLTKIGITVDVRKRFNAINSQSPVELTLLWYTKLENTQKIEKDIHTRYSVKRIKGEWFNLSSRDITWIKSSLEPDKDELKPSILNHRVRDVNIVSDDYKQSSMFY